MKRIINKNILVENTKKLAALALVFSFVFSIGSIYANTSQSPSVNTHSATNITASSATLNGYVDPHGNTSQAWFEWGTTSSLGQSTSKTSFSSASQFNRGLTGLSPNTTYYYRAVAENSFGKNVGDIRNFTTGSSVPVGQSPSVNTHSATNITASSATLNGYVDPHGNTSQAWFEWGTTSSLGQSTSKISFSSASQYNRGLTGLSSNTTYYFRAVAENSFGKNVGDIRNFTTGSLPSPTVDLKANNSNGPITVSYNSNVNLAWTSQNAASCQASGDWTGSKSISGSQTIQMNQVKTYVFTLTCKDSTGTKTSSDSVTVHVNPNLPTVITKPAVITY